jgi:hypothetical protein
MDDDLTQLRATGIVLSDDEAARFIALRQHFAPARAALEAVHAGETEPAATFRASSSPQPTADEEES